MRDESYPDVLVKVTSEMHARLGALRAAPPQPVPAFATAGLPVPAVSFPGWLSHDREVLHDALFDGIEYIARHQFSLAATDVSETFVEFVHAAFTDHRARVADDPLIVPILAAGAYGGALPDPGSVVRSVLHSVLVAVAVR